MKKRIVSLLLTCSLLLSMIPFQALSALAAEVAAGAVLYGDADGNGRVELLDVNLMERYMAGEEGAEDALHFAEADVNADGAVDQVDVDMVKEYLVGNLDSLVPVLHTIVFNTDGGGEIDPVQAGHGYPYRGELVSPAKYGYLFVKWVKEDGSTYYQHEEAITADMTLTAVYEKMDAEGELHIDSFTLEDQQPDLSFELTGDFSSAEEVKANITLLTKDGSQPVELAVTANGSGSFTVYAPAGFVPGASYELTLGDGLYFAGKDQMLRTAYFIIHKDEVDNLQYNADLIFIQDTEDMTYTVNGETLDVLESALLSNEGSTEAITGSFTMPQGGLEAGDVVCIYENIDPKDRDYTQNTYEDDALAYIRITGGENGVYQFESLNEEDADEVLAMPDTIPYQVQQLPTESGTVDKNAYDTYARSMLGMTEAPAFAVNDFLVFYTENFENLTENTPAVYGQITAVDETTVSYKIVTRDEMESFMSMFVSQKVNGEELLNEIDQEQVLENIRVQAEESGFAEEAANRMLLSALETEEIRQRMLDAGLTEEELQAMANSAQPLAVGATGGRTKFTCTPKVMPRFISGQNFENGVGVAMEICVDLAFEKKMPDNQISTVHIELSAYLEQEVALGFDVSIEDRWKWYLFIPVLQDLDVNVSVDVMDYTQMSVGAKIYTIRDEYTKKKWTALSETVTGPNASPAVRDAIRKINSLAVEAKKLKAKGDSKWEDIQAQIDSLKGALPVVVVDGVNYSVDEIEKDLQAEDVSAAFDETFNAETGLEAKTGVDQLMARYQEMLEQECDWIDLYNQKLFDREFHIKIVAVRVTVNFIVRANVNLAVGADLEYQVGKRYTFWLHVLDGTAGSSEMDLINERFGFQFYLMGTLGLKAGIKVDLACGLISTCIASVGANVEFGAYLKLYGYFIYYFSLERPLNDPTWVKEEEMMGALYLDFGLYVTVKFKAQALANTIKYEPTLYDGEFPLVTAGDRTSVYDFALQPDKEDVLYIIDEDSNSLNGISMVLPELYRTMKTMDLVTGSMAQEKYSPDKFILEFSDSRFSYDGNGKIRVDVSEDTRYMACNMRIVWKENKLAFSKFDTDITVPVVWTNYSESEMNQKFTASVLVGNETDGYTTVWSDRYSRVDTFDLPSQEEILELVNYNSYNTESGNLKYESVGGYQEQSTDLSLVTDREWLFDLTPKTYTLTVQGVQNADGSTTTRTYQALFGESFDLSGLKTTGTADPVSGTYTTFYDLVDASDNVLDGTITVDMAFAEAYGSSLTLEANYLDQSRIATFEFMGLGNQVPPLEVKFRQGTAPAADQVRDYAVQYGGPQTTIVSITPAVEPSLNSVRYQVVCTIDESRASYTLTYDTQDGKEPIQKQYLAGDTIYALQDPTRTGYTFAGWYADPEGTVPFDFEAGMPGADTTVYAKWEALTYTVSFDSGSGDVANPASVQVQYGQPYGTLPTLSRSGWKLVGWFTAKTGGEQVTAETIFQTEGNVTLYGRWEQKKTVDASWLEYEAQTTVDYDGNAHGFQFTVNAPEGNLAPEDFTVTYLNEKAGSEWTSEVPVNAGTYLVKIAMEENDDYLAFEMTSQPTVRINKIPMASGNLPGPQTSVKNWILTVDTSRCDIKGDGKITYEVSKMDDMGAGLTVIGEFENNGIDMKSFGAGTYTVRVKVAEGTNYKSIQSDARGFSINSNGNFGPKSTLSTSASDSSVESGITDQSAQEQPAVDQPAQEEPTVEQPVEEQPAEIDETLPTGAAGSAGIGLNTTSAISLLAEVNAQKTTMTISPEELFLTNGKTFEVSFALDRSIPVWGVLAAVNYDTDLLELAGYEVGGVFTESQFTFQEDTGAAPYKFLATLDTLDTTYAKDAFITLQFKVKDKAADKDTTVSLEMLEVVNKDSQVNVEKGNAMALAVDNTAPQVEGIKDGGTYSGDTTVIVKEAHLTSVTVNGKEVQLTDGKFVLYPADGKQTVVLTDACGHTTTLTVTVKPAPTPDEIVDNIISAISPASGDGGSQWLVAVLALSLLGACLPLCRKKRRDIDE